jgi:transcription elongation factor/antiterminator RfaH
MNFKEGEKWYAIGTKNGQENRVEFHLVRLGLEVLNPKQKKEKKVWGGSKLVAKPLFPGYLFAKFDPPNYLHTIQYTRGVRQVLHFGNNLLPVDEEIIQNIRLRLDVDGCVELDKTAITEGDPISVCEGPLTGFKGIFKRELGDRNRVVVLLDLMGAYARVVMEKRLVEIIP